MDEVQYFLKEEFHDEGTEIMSAGETCKSIIFIVSGRLNLNI